MQLYRKCDPKQMSTVLDFMLIRFSAANDTIKGRLNKHKNVNIFFPSFMQDSLFIFRWPIKKNLE